MQDTLAIELPLQKCGGTFLVIPARQKRRPPLDRSPVLTSQPQQPFQRNNDVPRESPGEGAALSTRDSPGPDTAHEGVASAMRDRLVRATPIAGHRWQAV